MGAPSRSMDPSKAANDSNNNSSSNSSNNNDTVRSYLSLIQQYLQVFHLENAAFLADRCVAEYPDCLQAVYLQALCAYRQQKLHKARSLLENSPLTPQMLYLAAQCSLELKDYTRAEEALLKETRTAFKLTNGALTMEEWILQTSPCPVPNGAAGLALLGSIYRQSNRRGKAVAFFRMSLQLDPFLWTSFAALAELGETDEPASVFGMGKTHWQQQQQQQQQPDMNPALVTATHASLVAAAGTLPPSATLQQQTQTPFGNYHNKTPLQPSTAAVSSTTRMATMMMMTPAPANNTTTGGIPFSARPPRGGSATPAAFETPGLTPIPMHNNASFLPVDETPAQESVVRRARQVASRQYYPPSPDTPVSNVTRSMRYLHGLSGMDTSAVSMTTTTRSLFATTSSENRSTVPPSSSSLQNQTNHAADKYNVGSNNNTIPLSSATPAATTEDTSLQKPEKPLPEEKVQGILQVLAIAGTAYQELCQYQCQKALQTLRLMPTRQQTTAWVLHQQGKAYLELGDFTAAQRCLEYMHKLEPGRMEGVELLSTVYWQLKKEVALASLAQRVVEWDRLAPQAWCVVGNCFSLQKDHESALAFFKRSLQLDPDFTYTHTLSGYEYMANEDFDKAMACFQKALRTNDRHYNAWYGLGGIYHRQEKYDLAEYHFERACAIHPGSSILRCNLGIAQYANNKAYQALETLSEASRLDPRNPQARFQRATIYSALHRPEEALRELEKVRDAAPREATVHFTMGKVLKRLGRTDEAMKCFLFAMDLDPKDSQMIKSAMDKLDDPEVDEEAMATF